MLGRALDATFRNFSTLFLVAAVLFLPLNLGHAFLFRNVHAVAELRGDIERFPEGRKVRNVGPPELDRESRTSLVLVLIEALMLVPMVGAARRVLEMDGDDVPTVLDAWRHAFQRPGRIDLKIVASAALLGGLMAFLVLRIGSLATEALGPSTTYLGVGLTRGIAAATLAAVVCGCAASPGRTVSKPKEKLDLY